MILSTFFIYYYLKAGVIYTCRLIGLYVYEEGEHSLRYFL